MLYNKIVIIKQFIVAETLLVWGENDRLLAEITRQFFEDFAPANIRERMLLEQMIFTQWRMLRVARSRIPNTRDRQKIKEMDVAGSFRKKVPRLDSPARSHAIF